MGMDEAKPETYYTWQPGYWLMRDVATGEWVFVRGDLLPNPKRWDRPSNQAKQGPLDAFWADDTQLAATAPPGAANAARRVFRKVTTLPSCRLAVMQGGFSDGDTVFVMNEHPPWKVINDSVFRLAPAEAIGDGLRGPRGKFRVVVEFTPDSEE